MKKYTFEELNPIEFEDLVNDLLEKEYNVRIERFKEGRDRGIDGRFTDKDGKKVIIQTKHYLKTGYDGLKQILVKKSKTINGVKKEFGELVKVEKLKISGELDKYIFVTSVGLTPNNKKEIFKIFNGYIKNESDIYGPDDLNNILSKNKDIEKNNNKLWLTSTNVLETIFENIINNDIYGRSNDEIKKYLEKNKYFYTTKDFNKSIDILNKNSVIIISGEPGIGKSTLSEQICLRFLSKGEFKFFKISENINEAEKIWKDDEKQLFYFDDFLGSNYLETTKGDNEIKNFIDRIKRNKGNKVFILNSRTTILKSGIENSAINGFKEDIEDNKYVLEVNKLSDEEKAYILYNHMFYSDLGEEYINKIYEEKNYKKIIEHKNYNPRLIEFITNKKRVNVGVDEYMDFIINNLDNPEEIWKQVFEKQSNEYINYLVYLTVFNGGNISEEILKNRYNIFVKKIKNGIIPTNLTFNNVIKIAIENFLVRNDKNGDILYSLINPSITDYILNKFINEEDFLIDIFDGLGTYEGLEKMISILSEKTLGLDIFDTMANKNKYIIKTEGLKLRRIILGLYEKNLEFKNENYLIYLFELIYGTFGHSKLIDDEKMSLVEKLIQNYNKGKTIIYFKLLGLLNFYFKEVKIENFDFLIHYFKKIDFTEENIEVIGEIIDYIYNKDGFDGYNQKLLEILKEKIEGYLEEEMEYLFQNIDFDDYVGSYEEAINFDLDFLINDKIGDIEVLLDSLSEYNFYSYIKEINVEDIFDGLGIDLSSEFEDYKKSLQPCGEEEYQRFDEMRKDMRGSYSNVDNNFNEVDYIFSK